MIGRLRLILRLLVAKQPAFHLMIVRPESDEASKPVSAFDGFARVMPDGSLTVEIVERRVATMVVSHSPH